jgi:hypothetical protein
MQYMDQPMAPSGIPHQIPQCTPSPYFYSEKGIK